MRNHAPKVSTAQLILFRNKRRRICNIREEYLNFSWVMKAVKTPPALKMCSSSNNFL